MPESRRNPEFAALLQRLMESHNLPSMTQLAYQARITGLSISRVLTAKMQPSWTMAYRLGVAYPDMAKEIFAKAGYPLPAELVPGVKDAAVKMGVSTDRVVEDAVRRLMEGAGFSGE